MRSERRLCGTASGRTRSALEPGMSEWLIGGVAEKRA